MTKRTIKVFEIHPEVNAGEYLYNQVTDYFFRASTDEAEIANRRFPTHDHIKLVMCHYHDCEQAAKFYVASTEKFYCLKHHKR